MSPRTAHARRAAAASMPPEFPPGSADRCSGGRRRPINLTLGLHQFDGALRENRHGPDDGLDRNPWLEACTAWATRGPSTCRRICRERPLSTHNAREPLRRTRARPWRTLSSASRQRAHHLGRGGRCWRSRRADPGLGAGARRAGPCGGPAGSGGRPARDGAAETAPSERLLEHGGAALVRVHQD